MYSTPQKPARAMGDEVQTSEQVLEAFSPTLSALHGAKRRRSVLGEAARVMTPCKKSVSTPQMDKENCVNTFSSSGFLSPPTKQAIRPAMGQSRLGTPSRTTTPLCDSSRRNFTPSKSSRPVTPSQDRPAALKRAVTLNRSARTVPASPGPLAQSPAPLMTSPRPNSGVMRVNLFADAEKQWRVSDFALGRPIGKGKFGNVYCAKRAGRDGALALKVVFKSSLQEEHALRMMAREVSLQHGLRHENVLRLHGYFQDLKSVYLVLDHASGGELYKFLRAQPHRLIDEERCRGFALQVVAALRHLHQRGILHRDLKPENLLLHGGRLLLADFGSAVQLDAARGLRFTVCGTPEYLAPEMIVGAGHDESLDMWALGILVFEMLYGRTPFVAPRVRPPTEVADPHREEALARQRMYERILSYSDRLAFPDQMLLADDSLPRDLQVTAEAKDVMQRLLRGDRTQRLDAAALQAHPWLAQTQQPDCAAESAERAEQIV